MYSHDELDDSGLWKMYCSGGRLRSKKDLQKISPDLMRCIDGPRDLLLRSYGITESTGSIHIPEDKLGFSF